MQHAFKISIALAVYNGEKYLHELLTSLENQTFQPAEIVILDDGSTDGSLKIINDFKFTVAQKRVFTNDINQGVNYSFKKIASLCKEEFIAFCDQDDIWKPGKLFEQLHQLYQLDNTAPGAVFTNLEFMNENGKLLDKTFWNVYKINPGIFCFKDVLATNVITGCTCIINQAMKNEIIKMPIKAILYDHWIALIVYSFGSYQFTKMSTVNYRIHTLSVTNKTKKNVFKNLYAHYKNRSIYLDLYIQQAKLFLEIYNSALNKKQKSQLQQFITLEHSSFSLKWLAIKKRALIRGIN